MHIFERKKQQTKTNTSDLACEVWFKKHKLETFPVTLKVELICVFFKNSSSIKANFTIILKFLIRNISTNNLSNHPV